MQQRGGFTLVELLVVLAVVGILTVVAYPSYQSYLTRGYWIQVKGVMHSLAGDLEEFRLTNANHGYLGAPWQEWLATKYSRVQHYRLQVVLTANSYQIIAVPGQAATDNGGASVSSSSQTNVATQYSTLILHQDGRQSCLPAHWQGCWEQLSNH